VKHTVKVIPVTADAFQGDYRRLMEAFEQGEVSFPLQELTKMQVDIGSTDPAKLRPSSEYQWVLRILPVFENEDPDDAYQAEFDLAVDTIEPLLSYYKGLHPLANGLLRQYQYELSRYYLFWRCSRFLHEFWFCQPGLKIPSGIPRSLDHWKDQSDSPEDYQLITSDKVEALPPVYNLDSEWRYILQSGVSQIVAHLSTLPGLYNAVSSESGRDDTSGYESDSIRLFKSMLEDAVSGECMILIHLW
jgi:hypothetical protein